MKRYIYILIAILSGAFIYYSLNVQKRFSKSTIYTMDTIVEIQVYYHGPKNIDKIMKNALSKFLLIDSICGYNSINGDIYNLNNKGKLKVSRYTNDIIKKAIDISQITNGYFDITINPIMNEWEHFSEPLKELPDSNRIKQLLKYVDFNGIKISGDTVSILDSMGIDLGGIAKGYAIDLAYDVLKESKLDAFLINAGGDIRVYSRNDKKWKIGIQNPRENNILGYFEIKNGAVVTSGDYEKYVMFNGVHYAHIINTKTGYPSQGIINVTVFAPSAK
ncbi:FAD:protein FMN transferase, partial [candidate division TA06 bacterium]